MTSSLLSNGCWSGMLDKGATTIYIYFLKESNAHTETCCRQGRDTITILELVER